jgi:hypothetical protein
VLAKIVSYQSVGDIITAKKQTEWRRFFQMKTFIAVSPTHKFQSTYSTRTLRNVHFDNIKGLIKAFTDKPDMFVADAELKKMPKCICQHDCIVQIKLITMNCI